MAERWEFQCRARLPRTEKARVVIVHAIQRFLVCFGMTAQGSFNYTCEFSTKSPCDLIIHVDWRYPPLDEQLELVYFKMQSDIDRLCANWIGDPVHEPAPRSVWEWLRVKDPYG